MDNQFTRVEFIIGEEKLKELKNKHVAIFGVGGVGSFVAEGLVRSGIGKFDLIDKDDIDVTNINRQIHNIHKSFFLPENSKDFDFSKYDYIVDAVDTVTAKLEIIMKAKEVGVPIISSMGAGNKLDPTKFQIADIYKTSVDPLASVMRRELKKRGIKKLTVVYSTEKAITPECLEESKPFIILAALIT